MILHNGRPHYPHDVPAGASVRPLVSDVVPIRKGDSYKDPMGFAQKAESDGVLLVELGQVICAERCATMLGQLGWKCRRRGGDGTGNAG